MPLIKAKANERRTSRTPFFHLPLIIMATFLAIRHIIELYHYASHFSLNLGTLFSNLKFVTAFYAAMALSTIFMWGGDSSGCGISYQYLHTYFRQPQEILLASSIDDTFFRRVYCNA